MCEVCKVGKIFPNDITTRLDVTQKSDIWQFLRFCNENMPVSLV